MSDDEYPDDELADIGEAPVIPAPRRNGQREDNYWLAQYVQTALQGATSLLWEGVRENRRQINEQKKALDLVRPTLDWAAWEQKRSERSSRVRESAEADALGNRLSLKWLGILALPSFASLILTVAVLLFRIHG